MDTLDVAVSKLCTAKYPNACLRPHEAQEQAQLQPTTVPLSAAIASYLWRRQASVDAVDGHATFHGHTNPDLYLLPTGIHTMPQYPKAGTKPCVCWVPLTTSLSSCFI